MSIEYMRNVPDCVKVEGKEVNVVLKGRLPLSNGYMARRHARNNCPQLNN